MKTHLLPVLVRVFGVLLVDAGYLAFLSRADDGVLTRLGLDDPLGAGMVGFLVLAAVGGLWGLLDGWRWRDYGRVAVVWSLAAPLAGLADVLVPTPPYGEWSAAAVDLTLAPLFALLVGGPALLAGLVGTLLPRSAAPIGPHAPSSPRT